MITLETLNKDKNKREIMFSPILIKSNGRTLIVDMNAKTITCDSKTSPVMKLSFNKSHVVKLNKTNISIYNVDMFVHCLKTNTVLFDSICMYIGYRQLITNIDTFVKDTNITVPEFYNSFNNNVGAFIAFFKNCSHETKQTIIYDHICFNHESKMNGVISLSTYVGYNRFCLARCKNCNAICSHCYANSLTKQRQGLKNKLIRIMAILTNIELTENDIPKIDISIYPFFRFEGFGDINNTLQFKNFNLIAAVNPNVNFTLWTKNPGIIQNAINNGLTIANNLVIGLSSLYLNKPELDKAQKYSFIRFLFTVYSPDYIQEHDIKINCGAKHCVSCGICYKYLHEFKHGLQLINEKLK